ncbi:MAG: alkaline phosphatase family protein [Verrucomicrobiota bacterium JB022]|nr:alkaline phosphatase family protein [Verrucomicrobiota bacterium JB022]
MKAKRTLLIGWDAADWRMIRPLLNRGKMPNLQRLIKMGVWGNLHTLHPVLSPMLWTSIGTGKRPYKHGINGFSEPDPATGAVRPVTNLSRKTKAVWNILNQSGKQSNVIGWWPSHPAEPINGVMVSNQFQRASKDPENWPHDTQAIHPSRLLQPLSEMRLHPAWVSGEMLLPFIPRAAEIDQEKDRRLGSLAKILAEISTVHAAATATMQLEPWDFMAVYYDGIDHFGHGFMKYHPPKDPRVSDEDFEIYRHVMESGYVFHDMMLGVLLQLAGPETNVMLISDHGFHPDHLRPHSLPNAPAGPASEHRRYGIFVMAGPDVKSGGEEIFSGSLLDITPTLLHAFGLPVGRDMDGKVLSKVFREKRPVEYVESWDAIAGDDGCHPSDRQLDARDAKAALQQLVDLGYIDQPDEDKEVAVAETVRELDYNLAQAYFDGKKFVEAHRIAVRLWAQWPEESRFGLLQLQCEMTLKAHDDLKRTFNRLNTTIRRYAKEAQAELARLDEEHKAQAAAGEEAEEKLRRKQPKIRRLVGRSKVDEAGLKFYEARVLMAVGEDEAARQLLESLTDTWPGRQQRLFRLLGDLCTRLNEPEKAVEWLEKALELDPDDAEAHLQLSRAQYLLGEDYISATHALTSLQLNYFNPRAHYAYGAALVRLGHLEWAVETLEVAVQQARHYPEAHELLAAIYADHLQQPIKAKAHQALAAEAREANAQRMADLSADLPSVEEQDDAAWKVVTANFEGRQPLCVTGKAQAPASERLTVVSGLPRSGTSMTMQMLVAAGLDPLTDRKRSADESNRKGYFEHERIKRLHQDNTWLAEGRGKALKVVAPLVKFLPPTEACKVIFMERHPREIMDSQRQMLERLQKPGGQAHSPHLARVLLQQMEDCQQALRSHPKCDLLTINYNALMNDPEQTIARIIEFLELPDDKAAAMLAVVDPQLYRSRL